MKIILFFDLELKIIFDNYFFFSFTYNYHFHVNQKKPYPGLINDF